MLRQLRHLRSQLRRAAAIGGRRATPTAYIVRATNAAAATLSGLHEPAMLCAASEDSRVAAATPKADTVRLAAALCLGANLAAATAASAAASAASAATPFVRAVVLLQQPSTCSPT